MTKRFLGFLALLGFLTFCRGVAEADNARQTSSDFTQVASSGTVSVATSAWTAVPSTATVDRGRWALFISNPPGNTATILYRTTNDDLRPGSTTYGHPLVPGESAVLSFSGFMRVWAVSLHTAVENLFFEELK